MNRRIIDAALAAFIFGLLAGLALAVPAQADNDPDLPLVVKLLPGMFDFSHLANLQCSGKLYYAIEVPTKGPRCYWLDCAKLSSVKWNVASGVSSGTRPIFDVDIYQMCIAGGLDAATCGKSPYWVEIKGVNVDVGVECDAKSIRKTSVSDYHKVKVGSFTGAALCKASTVSNVPTDQNKSSSDIATMLLTNMKSPTTPGDTAACEKLLGMTPAAPPAPTPAPATTAGANDYTFYCKSDDGCRVWVNNVLVVDNWKQQASVEASGPITLAPGKYQLKVDYFDATGSAEVHLAYSSSAIAKQIVPAAKLSNLAGLYFNFENFTGEATQRLDSNIDFNWGTGAPLDSVGADHFSVRWLGDITVP